MSWDGGLGRRGSARARVENALDEERDDRSRPKAPTRRPSPRRGAAKRAGARNRVRRRCRRPSRPKPERRVRRASASSASASRRKRTSDGPVRASLDSAAPPRRATARVVRRSRASRSWGAPAGSGGPHSEDGSARVKPESGRRTAHAGRRSPTARSAVRAVAHDGSSIGAVRFVVGERAARRGGPPWSPATGRSGGLRGGSVQAACRIA